MNILTATRKTLAKNKGQNTEQQIKKALNLLGYYGEDVDNYALACYDAKSVYKAVNYFVVSVEG